MAAAPVPGSSSLAVTIIPSAPPLSVLTTISPAAGAVPAAAAAAAAAASHFQAAAAAKEKESAAKEKKDRAATLAFIDKLGSQTLQGRVIATATPPGWFSEDDIKWELCSTNDPMVSPPRPMPCVHGDRTQVDFSKVRNLPAKCIEENRKYNWQGKAKAYFAALEREKTLLRLFQLLLADSQVDPIPNEIIGVGTSEVAFLDEVNQKAEYAPRIALLKRGIFRVRMFAWSAAGNQYGLCYSRMQQRDTAFIRIRVDDAGKLDWRALRAREGGEKDAPNGMYVAGVIVEDEADDLCKRGASAHSSVTVAGQYHALPKEPAMPREGGTFISAFFHKVQTILVNARPEKEARPLSERQILELADQLAASGNAELQSCAPSLCTIM